MAATYSGTVVRTTHMSGIITDLGTFLGHWMRGEAADARRVRLYLALFAGFLTGGMSSALVWPLWQEQTLLIPAVLTGFTGIAYFGYRRWRDGQGPVVG